MDLELRGRHALVTGADRGSGAVIAHTLEAEGARVTRCGAITCEADSDAVLASLETRVDILVNNYGTAERHKWRDADTATWYRMLEINLLSAARMVQGLAEGMRTGGWGRIVNLGTIGSHQPNNVMPAYYAAKGALATLGVGLAKELAGTGITVNTVSPGLILSEEWVDKEAEMVEKLMPNPCGRMARREEVADLVAFLCSERAAFINGQNIRIDGGAVRYV